MSDCAGGKSRQYSLFDIAYLKLYPSEQAQGRGEQWFHGLHKSGTVDT